MEKTKHSFSYWQWRTIIGTMIGYAVFYFVRKNLSFAIPGLTAEYGISKSGTWRYSCNCKYCIWSLETAERISCRQS